MPEASLRAGDRPESLREEIQRRARAEEAGEFAQRRARALERRLGALIDEAGPLVRLKLATVGSPATREVAVAVRSLGQALRGRGGVGSWSPRAARRPAGGRSHPTVARERERRREAERALRRTRRRVAHLEWRIRAYGWRAASLATGFVRAGEAARNLAHAAMARAHNAIAARGGERSPGSQRSADRRWPAVTAVVHGGPWSAAARARRLIAETDYPRLRVVRVATGSRGADFGPEVAEAIRSAAGDLILVCSGLRISDPGWLRGLVEALLADPALGGLAPTSPTQAPGPRVVFDLADGAPLPVLAPGGRSEGVLRVAALGGGCALLRADALRRELLCGTYGSDLWLVDHSISLRDGGWELGILDVGAAAASPQRGWREDLRLLRSRWGPVLRRRVLTDLASGGGSWCPRGARVALPGPSSPALEELAERLGWAAAGAGGADIALSVTGANEGTQAVAAQWRCPTAEPGAELLPAPVEVELDSGGDSDGRLRGRLLAAVSRPSICIQLGAPDWDAALAGGDYFLAASLRDELVRRGHEVLIAVDAEAGTAPGSCFDVLLHLRGRRPAFGGPGQYRLIWHLSHPDEVGVQELRRFDAVLVASRERSRDLDREIEAPVHEFLQFTDPGRFFPPGGTAGRHELLFVGNWRGVFRRVVWDVLPTGRELSLCGRGWRYMLPELTAADHVPNAELHRLYSACRILLADHWEDMRRHGFISNRIFDALACEAFVISDYLEALEKELAGGVETYREPAELHDKVERYLDDPAARREIARRGRELVLRSHTVEQRADRLLRVIEEGMARCERPFVGGRGELGYAPSRPA